MSASFSTWLSVGVGSRGTRRVDSTRALPCQEVSDADCRGNWKRPRFRQERIWLTGVSNYQASVEKEVVAARGRTPPDSAPMPAAAMKLPRRGRGSAFPFRERLGALCGGL